MEQSQPIGFSLHLGGVHISLSMRFITQRSMHGFQCYILPAIYVFKERKDPLNSYGVGAMWFNLNAYIVLSA